MFRYLVAAFVLSISSCGFASKTGGGPAYQPVAGDILFQSLPNPAGMDLVDAIEGSTGSPYSHCGMVFQEDGSWLVIEAIEGPGNLPLDRKMVTPRDLAKAKELTRVYPAG